MSMGTSVPSMDNNAKPAEMLPQSMNSDMSIQKQSYFKNIQLQPINGSSNIEVKGSQQQTQFEIPISAWNPYWSVLSFSVKTPTGHAGDNCINVIPTNYCPWFNRIELYTASGSVYLVNIQQADFYSYLACPVNHDYKEVPYEEGFCARSQRKNWGTGYTPAANDFVTGDPLFAVDAAGTAKIGVVPNTPFVQGQSICNTTTAANPATAMNQFTYSISLRKLLPDSFFNINNTFWLSKVLYLRLTWNPISNIMFSATSTAASPTVITTYDLANDSKIDVSNINLQINVEGDEGCIQAKKMLAEQPSTIVVPYIYNWSQAQNGNGTLQTSYTLASDGSAVYKLYRLYSGLSRSLGNFPISFANWNTTAAPGFQDTAGIFNRVFLYINGILIKNYNLDPTSLNMLVSDIKNNFTNSSLEDTRTILVYGGIPQQFTTDPSPEQDNDVYSNMIAKGLDASKSNLAINIQYQMAGAGNVSAQLYLFPVTLKSFGYSQGVFNYQ